MVGEIWWGSLFNAFIACLFGLGWAIRSALTGREVRRQGVNGLTAYTFAQAVRTGAYSAAIAFFLGCMALPPHEPRRDRFLLWVATGLLAITAVQRFRESKQAEVLAAERLTLAKERE